jgi:uncharacterized protein (TIGR02001 family)
MSIIRSASLGAASLLAAAVFAGPSFADGLPGRGKIAASHGCSVSGSVALTSDYVFRGVSQTFGNPAAQSNLDLTCGKFYLGAFASNIDFGIEGTLELDIYGGYKFSTGRVNWDVGFIYYSYPGMDTFFDADYLELKLSASADIIKGGTLTGTVYYSPEYTFGTGTAWTVEGTFSQVLPKMSIFSPTFSATVGNTSLSDFDVDYTYWNVGVTLGFRDKWSLDLRYWDTDNQNVCGIFGICDDRFVATLKYSF